MERRSSKQSEYSTQASKEVHERRTSTEADVEEWVRLEDGTLRKALRKPLKLNVNIQEDGFFEESKLELPEKPVITFNHVSTVTESEQISFEAIRKAGSRSPSPLLEVPAFKVGSKQAVRPPL